MTLEQITHDYLEGLLQEDKEIVQADANLQRARAAFDMQSRKYAAIRDLVVRHLGTNPYSFEREWPSRGRFRFIHMTVGDAAMEALREAGQPVPPANLMVKLAHGGLRERFDLRTINAALLNRGGVHKDDDGNFVFEAKEADIPFE